MISHRSTNLRVGLYAYLKSIRSLDRMIVGGPQTIVLKLIQAYTDLPVVNSRTSKELYGRLKHVIFLLVSFSTVGCYRILWQAYRCQYSWQIAMDWMHAGCCGCYIMISNRTSWFSENNIKAVCSGHPSHVLGHHFSTVPLICDNVSLSPVGPQYHIL